MKIVTLIENTACRENLTAEHGLSLFIEACGKTFLFDAGESGAFAENARKLGVDLHQVEFAALSHGHHDHGNGLVRFLEENDHAPVYLSCHAFARRYNAKGKYIGIDPVLEGNPRLRLTDGETKLAEGITLHCIPLPPMDTAGMTVEENGTLIPEDFRHEQYLLVEEEGKRILFSGCSHKGILNIVRWFRPHILIGGFHFMNVEDEAFLKVAAQELMGYDTVYYTGHCTGQTQYARMKEIMGDRLHYLSTGSCLEIL